MTEYQIVCDRKMIRKDTNTGRTAKRAPCQTVGHIFSNFTTVSREDAERMLLILKELCAEYDVKTAESDDSDVRVHQTNIRIQSREVTDWSDID